MIVFVVFHSHFTRREKPKRKVVNSTIEMKKELITKWERGTLYRSWLLNIPPTIIID
jgi:hypothetical protein